MMSSILVENIPSSCSLEDVVQAFLAQAHPQGASSGGSAKAALSFALVAPTSTLFPQRGIAILDFTPQFTRTGGELATKFPMLELQGSMMKLSKLAPRAESDDKENVPMSNYSVVRRVHAYDEDADEDEEKRELIDLNWTVPAVVPPAPPQVAPGMPTPCFPIFFCKSARVQREEFDQALRRFLQLDFFLEAYMDWSSSNQAAVVFYTADARAMALHQLSTIAYFDSDDVLFELHANARRTIRFERVSASISHEELASALESRYGRVMHLTCREIALADAERDELACFTIQLASREATLRALLASGHRELFGIDILEKEQSNSSSIEVGPFPASFANTLYAHFERAFGPVLACELHRPQRAVRNARICLVEFFEKDSASRALVAGPVQIGAYRLWPTQ